MNTDNPEQEMECPNCLARIPRRSIFREFNRYPRRTHDIHEQGLAAATTAYTHFGVALSDSGLFSKVEYIIDAYLDTVERLSKDGSTKE